MGKQSRRRNSTAGGVMSKSTATPSRTGADIYIESTKPTFKCSPQNVKLAGGLSKKYWSTTLLTRMELSPNCGCYMAENFHRRPHWMEPSSERGFISSIAAKEKVKLRHVGHKSTIVWPGDLAVFGEDVVSNELDSIDFVDLLKSTLKRTKGEVTEDRGNVRADVGYGGLHNPLDDESGVTGPVKLNATTKEDVELMCKVTSIMETLCKSANIDVPYSNDPERTRRFAQKLCTDFGLDEEKKNRLEAVSIAVNEMDDSKSFFGCHVDPQNCKRKGWTSVFTIYKIVYFNGKYYRVSVIGYSRNAIASFLVREKGRDILFQNLKAYYNYTKDSRARLSVEDLPEEGVSLRLPAHQKTGFYSAFADVFHQADESGLPALTLEQCCEVLLPVGFITTAMNYHELWLQCLTEPTFDRSQNLTFHFFNACLEKYGGILKGAGQRCTVSFNHSVYEQFILSSLKTLRSVILNVNAGGMDYDQATKELKTIKGCSDLQSQHILAVAAVAGIIDRPDFVARARICKGTTTWKKIQQAFNLKEPVMNRLYTDLAEELGIDTATVENVACEYFRDVDIPTENFDPVAYEECIRRRLLRDGRGYSRPDVCFADQYVYWYSKSKDNHVVISKCSRRQPAVVSVEGRGFRNPELCDYERWSTRCPRKIYQVSTSSQLAVVKERGPTRMKKISNSGLGVHHGLAELVKERHRKRLRGIKRVIEKDETFECNILKGKRYLINMRQQKMLRSSVLPLDQYVFFACREEGTYRHIDLVTTAVSDIHRQVVKPVRRGKLKRLRDYIVCYEHVVNDGKKYWTAAINSAHRTTMPGNHASLPVRGYVGNYLSEDGRYLAYYESQESACRAVLIFTLVVCAPNFLHAGYSWASRLFPQDCNFDFVVLYCGVTGASDELFGILTRSKDDDKHLVLSIPIHTSPLETLDKRPWQDFHLVESVQFHLGRQLLERKSKMPTVNYLEVSSCDSSCNDDDSLYFSDSL